MLIHGVHSVGQIETAIPHLGAGEFTSAVQGGHSCSEVIFQRRPLFIENGFVIIEMKEIARHGGQTRKTVKFSRPYSKSDTLDDQQIVGIKFGNGRERDEILNLHVAVAIGQKLACPQRLEDSVDVDWSEARGVGQLEL